MSTRRPRTRTRALDPVDPSNPNPAISAAEIDAHATDDAPTTTTGEASTPSESGPNTTSPTILDASGHRRPNPDYHAGSSTAANGDPLGSGTQAVPSGSPTQAGQFTQPATPAVITTGFGNYPSEYLDRSISLFRPQGQFSPQQASGATRTINQMIGQLQYLDQNQISQLQQTLWQSGMLPDNYYTGALTLSWGYLSTDTITAFSNLLEQGALRPNMSLGEIAQEQRAANLTRLQRLTIGDFDEQGRPIDPRTHQPVVLSDINVTDRAALNQDMVSAFQHVLGRDATDAEMESFAGGVRAAEVSRGQRHNELELAQQGWERRADGSLHRLDEQHDADPTQMSAFRESLQRAITNTPGAMRGGVLSPFGDAAMTPAQEAQIDQWREEARQLGQPLPASTSPQARQMILDWHLNQLFRATGGDWGQVADMWVHEAGTNDPNQIGRIFQGSAGREAYSTQIDPTTGQPVATPVANPPAGIGNEHNQPAPGQRNAETEGRGGLNRTHGQPTDPALLAGQGAAMQSIIDNTLTGLWSSSEVRGLIPGTVRGARPPTSATPSIMRGFSGGQDAIPGQVAGGPSRQTVELGPEAGGSREVNQRDAHNWAVSYKVIMGQRIPVSMIDLGPSTPTTPGGNLTAGSTQGAAQIGGQVQEEVDPAARALEDARVNHAGEAQEFGLIHALQALDGLVAGNAQ